MARRCHSDFLKSYLILSPGFSYSLIFFPEDRKDPDIIPNLKMKTKVASAILLLMALGWGCKKNDRPDVIPDIETVLSLKPGKSFPFFFLN